VQGIQWSVRVIDGRKEGRYLTIVLLLCYATLVMVLGTGIPRGQYYWTLDTGCLAWYCSKPNNLWHKVHNTENQALPRCRMCRVEDTLESGWHT